jgi:hypothetical protein
MPDLDSVVPQPGSARHGTGESGVVHRDVPVITDFNMLFNKKWSLQ